MPRGQYCNIDGHITGDLYAKNLRRLKDENRRLEHENQALQALTGADVKDSEAGDLLVALAEALSLGHAFANVHEAAQVTDHTKTGRQQPRSDEPKGRNRAAHAALRELIRGVESRIERFHNRRSNDWRRPEFDWQPAKLSDAVIRCNHCGRGFSAMRSDARFCSDRCRKAHQRAAS